VVSSEHKPKISGRGKGEERTTDKRASPLPLMLKVAMVMTILEEAQIDDVTTWNWENPTTVLLLCVLGMDQDTA
jgi:hypothetical protein